MANANDWIEEVKRWVASGSRSDAQAEAGLDLEALGYEAAQPALQAQERAAITERRPQ